MKVNLVNKAGKPTICALMLGGHGFAKLYFYGHGELLKMIGYYSLSGVWSEDAPKLGWEVGKEVPKIIESFEE